MIELLFKGLSLVVFLGVSLGILTSMNVIQHVDFVTFTAISFVGFLVGKL
jgi:hypothetical protein